MILENKDTAVYFPPVPGGIVVEGEGAKAPGNPPLILWVKQCPHVIYWATSAQPDGASLMNAAEEALGAAAN